MWVIGSRVMGEPAACPCSFALSAACCCSLASSFWAGWTIAAFFSASASMKNFWKSLFLLIWRKNHARLEYIASCFGGGLHRAAHEAMLMGATSWKICSLIQPGRKSPPDSGIFDFSYFGHGATGTKLCQIVQLIKVPRTLPTIFLRVSYPKALAAWKKATNLPLKSWRRKILSNPSLGQIPRYSCKRPPDRFRKQFLLHFYFQLGRKEPVWQSINL